MPAESIDIMIRVLLIVAGFCTWCCSATCGQLASPPLSPADRALVRRCQAFYGISEDRPGIQKESQAAKQFLDAMPRSELERRLVPIRKTLYRGTHTYTSVAFVLAYYGIDFDHNAQRVVEAIRLGWKPPAKLRAIHRFSNEDFDYSGEYEVAYAVERLYKRRHSARLLVSYLRAPSDGAAAEDQADTVATLFLAYPTDVLWAARKDLERLSDCLGYDSGDVHGPRLARRTLRTLEHHHDPQTASLAKDLHRRLERYLKRNPP